MLCYKLNEYRIGLVGHLASGKTVFLTSLIDHLRWHDPETFQVGANGEVVTSFEPFRPKRGWGEFDYERYRSGLNDGDWPPKTTDRQQFVCTYRLDARWRRRIRLKFYDVPGERMADAAMLRNDFPAWSDKMIGAFQRDKAYRDCAGNFLDVCRSNQPSESEILREYKLALARLITVYKQYISPSTFLLDRDGKQASDAGGPEAMAENCHCGLAGQEFCPLPCDLREKRPDLAKQFRDRYAHYRREVVLPIMRTLVKCNRMIVLVDVLAVLAGGVGMYHDNLRMADNLFRGMKLGRRLTTPLVLLPGVHPGGVSKLACVAPMIDRVAGAQNRANTLLLLQQMLQKPLANFPWLTKKYFVCSAVESTVPAGAALRAVLTSGGDFVEYTPSDVPNRWPNSWQPGQYKFPEPYPVVSELPGQPPNHIDLNEVFRFIVP